MVAPTATFSALQLFAASTKSLVPAAVASVTARKPKRMAAFVSCESMWLIWLSGCSSMVPQRALARGRRLVSQRSTSAITCRGQRYGRASGGLLHAKPNVALPTLAVDHVVVARRLIGKVMTVGAQAIGAPVVQRGVGGGGLSVDHFAHCTAGSAGLITHAQ